MFLSLARPVTKVKVPAISVILVYIYIIINTKAKAKEFKTMAQIAHSNIKFGLSLLKKIASGSPGENFFFSPFSIQAVMAMLHLGSKNNSKSEIEKALHFEGDAIHQALADYLKLLRESTSSYSLSSANRVFINNKFSFLDEYLSQLREMYKAEAQTCDFGGDPDGEKDRINQWVEGETNSKIKDLLPSGMLNSLTAMVLVNAIYFKGNWDSQFVAEDTVQEKFHVDKSSYVNVQMMKMEKKLKFGYSERLACSVVELPYVNKDLSMFVLLPHETDGVSVLESSLNPDNLKQLTESMREVKVNLALPKFKMEASVNLKGLLQSLGLTDIFSDSADLSGIDGSRDLYVSEALHKAFVEVNEEGTEAAAATAVVIMKRSLPIIEPFHADHPFLFCIRDNRAGVILFWGKLNIPDGEVVKTQHQEL